jgi:hypothetical protein
MAWGTTDGARTATARRVMAATAASHLAIVIGCLIAAPFAARLPIAFGLALALIVPCHRLARAVADRLPELGPPASGPQRALALAAVLVAALSVAQTARVGAFMLDERLSWGAALPGSNAHHMCLPAYLRAAELDAAGEANLYRPELYSSGQRSAPSPPTGVVGMAPWLSDPYQYPPTFLLAPRAALALSQDFPTLRAAWFALHAGAFGVIALLVALRVRPERRWRALALVAAAWSAVPILVNFQFGQVHLLVIAIAVAAMLAFQRKWDVLGGLLLASAIVAKIFPGVLGLVLVMQRRWRAAAATAAGAVALAAAARLIVGDQPFAAFVGYQLPRMASGQAFVAFFDDPFAVAENVSIPGIGYKLAALGLVGAPDAFAASAKWPWVVVLLGAMWLTARVDLGAERAPIAWLSLLLLASLLSPYAPGSYALGAAIWLLALIATSARLTARSALVLCGLWLAWQLAPVMGDLPVLWRWPRLAIAGSLAAVAALVGACGFGLRLARAAP